MADLPALSGRQFRRLLEADGWKFVRYSQHGALLTKRVGGESKNVVVKNTSRDLPNGTLAAILSQRQTGLGRDGLLRLIERHGL